MVPLITPEMRTIKFIDSPCHSKKEIFLRTGQFFTGLHFSGDDPVGKLNKSTLESLDALNRSLEAIVEDVNAGSDE